MRSIRRLLVLLVTFATVVGMASPAYADGTFSINKTQGDYRITVSSRADDVKLTVAITDDNCDSHGAGVIIKAYSTGGTWINEWKYRNSSGCNSTRMHYPIYEASELKGHRTGYLTFSTYKFAAGIGDYDFDAWTSTHYKIG